MSTGTPGFGGDGSGGGGAGNPGQPGGDFGEGGGDTSPGGPVGGGGGGVGGGGGGGGGAGIANAGHGGGGGFGGGGGAGGSKDTSPSPGAGGNGGNGGFGGGGGAGGIGLNAAPDGSAGLQGFGGGGGFANAGGGGAGMGGAIFNMQGEVTIRASTLTENTAIGGIDNVPDNQIDPAAGLGGVVFNLSGSVEVVGSTLAGNVASKSGGSIYNTVLDAVTERTGLTTLRDTIVADAGAPTDLVSAKFAGVPSGEFNLGSANAAVGDLNLVLSMTVEELGTIAGTPLTVDPKLGALSNNGGGTQTLAPAPDSPVVDAGSAFGLGADQRGLPRPSDFAPIANAGDGSDIGAFELQTPQGPAPLPGAQPKLVGSRVSARFRLRGRSTIVRRLRVARLRRRKGCRRVRPEAR